MTKVINIPGRLHSVEQGNIVAGANEVYDDTKGKKQNVINSETDAELLRLEQTKQDNLTFDNAPTENSNNPVKSGGVYAADLALQQAIEAILLLIPSAATSLNQLADKAFVNSSISTATATFRGTYNVVTDLQLAVDATHAQIEAALALVVATADNNDYCYVQIPVSSSSQDIQKTSRYKFNGSAWVFEYDLNTSGFTSAQWAAINSGITAALVTKLGDLPTATELSTDLQALSTAIGSEETRAKGVEQDLSTAIQGILGLIPSEATSSNKLADKTYVTNLINAITALIPAEATNLNQLADKAYVLAQILAATPAFKGQFTTLADLEAVSSPKAGDIGIVRTTDNDGFAVFTFYQYLNSQWNVYYTLAHHLQNKPATTGTTGDYPYNGMGRVVLSMNIKEIGGVTANYLEQSMMPTATGGNTIYVITHDYVLASDITIPANCVLEFEGGSLSASGSNDTITGNNTYIKAGLCKIFSSDINLDGTWNVKEAPITWFGANTSNADNAIEIKKALDFGYLSGAYVLVPDGIFIVSSTIQVSYVTRDVQASPDVDIINVVGTNNAMLKAGGNITDMIVFRECSVIICFRNIHFHGNGMEVKLINMVETANNVQAQMQAENCRFTHIEGDNSACVFSFHGYAHLTQCVIQGTGTGGGIGVYCRTTDISLIRCRFAYLKKAVCFDSMAEATVNAYACWFQVCYYNIYYNANASIAEPSTFVNCYFVESRNFTKHIGFDNSGAYCIIGNLTLLNCQFDGGDSNGVLIDLSDSGIYGNLNIIGGNVYRPNGNEPIFVKVWVGLITKIINSKLELITPCNKMHTKFIDYNGGASTGAPMASVAGDNIRHCTFPVSENQPWVNHFGVASITTNGIIVPAGLYKIKAVSFCYAGGNNRLSIKDGDGNLLAAGISDYCSPETVVGDVTVPGSSCVALLETIIAIPEQKEIILYHNIEYANSNGLGHGGNRPGSDYIDNYAYIDIERMD